MTEKHFCELPDALINNGACFVAALDCISKNRDVPINIYQEWINLFWEYYPYGDAKKTAQMYHKALMSIGITFDDVKMGYANTASALLKELEKVNQGQRALVVLDDDGSRHDVGVTQTPTGQWHLTGEVREKTGEYSVEDLFQMIYKIDPAFYNFMLLPPEK